MTAPAFSAANKDGKEYDGVRFPGGK